MTPEQTQVVNAVIRWLQVRGQADHIHYGGLWLSHLLVDADHSALLARLLDGKEPLPVPPPKSMSYPNYALIETGKAIAYEAWDSGNECVVIDQFPWKIVEHRPDGSRLVSYRDGAPRYVLSRTTVERPQVTKEQVSIVKIDMWELIREDLLDGATHQGVNKQGE